MVPEKEMTKKTCPDRKCPDANGTLPACAPLAVPYVPFQQEHSCMYQKNDALAQGTLFPGLNLPFRLKINGDPVPVTPLTELQALHFVLVELGLYLDTHKDDEEAFAMFRQYTELEKEGKRRYEAMFGPLTLIAAGEQETYRWCHGPWPWEIKGGKR